MKAFPGTEVEMILQPVPDIPIQPPVKYRGMVKNAVLGCTRCELRQGCTQPVPFEGPTGATFVAIGEAPGRIENEKGKPFVGPAGKLLRALIRDNVKVDPDDDVMYMNTVSCAPLEGKGVRAPKEPEQIACRENLMQQLVAAQTSFVLLCGANALKAFRHDLNVTDVHGELFLWMDTYLVMPIFHPAAILRDRNLKKPTQDDLSLWHEVVRSSVDLRDWIGLACIKCRTGAYRWDGDGVPYCQQHWEKNKDNWKRARTKWKVKGYQQKML